MSNATSKVPTSVAPSGPTQVPSSTPQQPSSAPSAPAASSSVATPSAAQPPSSTPQQQQPSNPPTAQPQPSSVPPAPAPSPSTPTPSNPEQQPPAPTTPTQPQNDAPAPAPTSASTPSAVVPPVVVTQSSDSPRQPPANSLSTVVTVRPSNTATSIEVVTATSIQTPGSAASPSSAAGSTSTPTPIDPSSSGSNGLSQPSKVAIGVVVPIAAIALLAIMGLFWWRKRRARQEAEEERRKEVEDYSYNPNADPTIPSVGHSASNSYEMKEDNASGYRGWGSTAVGGSTGRKASTTLSGGGMGAYSDMASPTRGTNPSEARSVEPLLDGSSSPDGEILGAMGPSAAYNRGGDVRRGPSNASSSYSVAARSENSDGGLYGNGSNYYEQYGQNPYGEQRPHELQSQAVIRDNPARRNTRIENSAHYPQQSAGIAQNF